jgi:hypothetical protein
MGENIRNLAIGILLGFLVAVPIAYTQQQPERIVIGETPLQIGIARDSAISQIAEHGLTVNKMNGEEEMWIVSRKNDRNEYDTLGMLTFINSRLSGASRSWASSTDPATTKLARNFYFLLKSFEDDGNTSCTIATQKQESPDFDNKQLLIHCGKRTAMLYVTAYKDQKPAATLSETIQ